MLVAINAQLVSFSHTYRNAGVSRFTYGLLDGLSALPDDAAPDQRYLAYINRAEAESAHAGPLGARPRLSLEAARADTAHPARRVAWEQATLPGLLRAAGAEVFHSPVNVLPARVPCASVVTVHDLAFYRYPAYFRPARRYYQQVFTRASARRATLVVAVSESTRRDLIEFTGVAPERVRVIPPAIADDFRPAADPGAVAAFRARHGLPARYILFLGTLEPRKNIPLLVEAYARLRAEVPDAPRLVIAGAKGWYFQSIFERVRSLGLEEAITFAGYVAREEQPMWYAGAELFVYPSVYEGFGLPVVEALACGTPTITSSVSSLPEAAGNVALTVDPSDASALAYSMRSVLSDPLQRAQMSVEGPRWAATFDVARMARAYTAVYEEAAHVRRDAGKGRG